MARPTRDIRRPSVNVGQLTAGDFILLLDSVLLLIALLINEWAKGASISLKYSEWYFYIVLIMLLVSTVLIVYPLIESEVGLSKATGGDPARIDLHRVLIAAAPPPISWDVITRSELPLLARDFPSGWRGSVAGYFSLAPSSSGARKNA